MQIFCFKKDLGDNVLDSIGNIDFQDKKEKIFSYLKYGVLIILIIPIYFLIRNFIYTYGDLEKDLIKLAKEYIKENDIEINDSYYVALGDLGEVEGAELCSNASGVIVTRAKNKYEYQAYLNCYDYESKIVKNKEKYVTLSGDEVTLLNLNEIYDEKGFYTEDDVDVKSTGSVGRKEGVYTLNYAVYKKAKLKETLTRKVIVTKYDKLSTNSGVTSNDRPTLTLFGNTTMILEVGEQYEEPGYKAVDYKDGKVTREVEIEYPNGKINTNRITTYTILYSITNSDNKTTTKTRTVKIVREKSDIVIDSKIKKQTAGYAIILNITGSGYTNTILPDGTSTANTSITYQISNNGTYKFAVYDLFNNVTIREIEVNDVDITSPTGNCIANVNNGTTMVALSATDKSGIGGYNYVIDGIATGFIDSSNYTSKTSAEKVIAQVKDSYGNTSTLTCQVNDISRNVGTMTGGIMNIPLYLQTNYTKPIPWGNGKTATVKRYGCGPTSVSMIVTYLTGNINQNPQDIFEWLNSLNYFHGHGFGKAALTKAANKYGVTCEWKSLNADSMKTTLLSGKPIIAFMGKGTFTTGGHYIVLKGVTSDGRIAINDPFSESKTKKTYTPELILSETRTGTPFAVCSI